MNKAGKGVVTALVGASLLLSGCGSSGTGNNSSQSKNVTVNMWADSASDTTIFNDQIAIVKKANPDLTIESQTAPWGDFFTKLTANMSSGNMACVTAMNSAKLNGYVDGFAELSDADLATAGLKKSDFTPGSLDILSDKGKLYGLPFDVATLLVYYNADLLRAAGVSEPKPGWTFDDFLATAKAATRDKKYGFAVSIREAHWQALPMAKSGIQPVSKDGTLQLTNQSFVDAATWYSDLVTKEKVAAPVASASDLLWGKNQTTGGNAAMAVDGTWDAVSYLKNDSGFKAGMTTLPKGEAAPVQLILGSGYGISKNCANKTAALKVLGSLLGKDAQNLIASSGRSYPARAESQPLYFDSIDEKYRAQVKEVFQAAFAKVEGQHFTKNWAKLVTSMQPQMVNVYSGQTTMSDLLSNTQKQFG